MPSRFRRRDGESIVIARIGPICQGLFLAVGDRYNIVVVVLFI